MPNLGTVHWTCLLIGFAAGFVACNVYKAKQG